MVIERIYRYQFKSNYLKHHNHFAEFFFFKFLKCTLNDKCSETKNEPHRSTISEVIDSKRCAYLKGRTGLLSESPVAVNALTSPKNS